MTPPFKKPLTRTLIVTGLAASVLVAGCTLPFGIANVSKETQTASIKESISSIKGTIKSLSESADSLRTVSAATTNPGAFYRIQSLYTVLGSQNNNGLTVNWDDTSKQLTSITGTDTQATFSFSGQGANRRLAKATLNQSPDGTTGSGEIEVEATTWNDSGAGAEAPQFWYNQSPANNTVTYLRAKVDLTPKGRNDQKVAITAGAENFQTFDMPGMTAPVPTHLYAKGSIPKLAFDQTVDIKKAGSTQVEVTWNGTMAIDTEKNGRQDWTINVNAKGDSSASNASKIDFVLENTSQKFKLTGSALPKTNGVLVTGKFTSTDGGHELATLSFDSTSDSAPVIKYADGTADYLRLD